MRISDWSSDVCSSDLQRQHPALSPKARPQISLCGPAAESVPSHHATHRRYTGIVGQRRFVGLVVVWHSPQSIIASHRNGPKIRYRLIVISTRFKGRSGGFVNTPVTSAHGHHNNIGHLAIIAPEITQ